MIGLPAGTRIWIAAASIVEHKRLSHVLELAQAVQAQRDNRRIGKAPSRTHLGVATKVQGSSPGKKKQREFTQDDINIAIMELAQRRQPKQQRKPARRAAEAG